MNELKGQMSLFEFIENPKTMLELLEFKKHNPICECTNCLCNYCVNNVESITVECGEVIQPCFECDYCKEFSGEKELRNMRKENCSKFEITNHAAKRKRNKLRIVGGKGVHKMSEVR